MSAGEPAAREEMAPDHTVQWLGAGEVPQAILLGFRGRGVRLAEEALDPRPPSRVADVYGLSRAAQPRANLEKRRVLVLDSNPEHANLLTLALGARGAATRAFGGDTVPLDDVAMLDADAILVDEQEFFAASWADACAVWKHARLRWTPFLILPSNLLQAGSERQLDALCTAVHALCEGYDRTVRRAAERRVFELSLSTLGPARSLRALLAAGGSLRAQLATQRVRIDVDVAENVILGARGGFTDGSSIELNGARALACLLAEETGTVLVGPADQNPLTNIRAPFENALRRGPDGAWLAQPEQPIPAAAHVDSSLDHDDETLIGSITSAPGSSGVRLILEARAAAAEQAAASQRASQDQPGEDAESVAGSTRKHPAASLLAIALDRATRGAESDGTQDAKAPEQASATQAPLGAESPAQRVQEEANEPSRLRALLSVTPALGLTPEDLKGAEPRRSKGARVGGVVLALVAFSLLVLLPLGTGRDAASKMVKSPHLGTAREAATLPSAAGSAPVSTPKAAPVEAPAEAPVEAPAEAPEVPAEAPVEVANEEPVEAEEAPFDDETLEPSEGSEASPESENDRAVAKLVRRANAQRRKGLNTRARDNLMEALALIPDDPRALYALGRLALEERDADVALNCARKLVAQDASQDTYRSLLERAEKLAGLR